MWKRTLFVTLLIIGTFFIITPCAQSVNAGLSIDEHLIEITTQSESFFINEQIIFNNTNNTAYTTPLFAWVQDNPLNLKIHPENDQINITSESPLNNIYQYNLLTYNLSILPNSTFVLAIEYSLQKTTDNFQKEILYTTRQLTVQLDEKSLYESTNLASDASIEISLSIHQESPISLIMYLVYILIIVIIVGAIFYTLRRIRGKRIESPEETGTAEFLMTKKKLLLNFLKELEKEHRSQKISDHTYNKLKEEYKRQAVQVMKNLDERTVEEDTQK